MLHASVDKAMNIGKVNKNLTCMSSHTPQKKDREQRKKIVNESVSKNLTGNRVVFTCQIQTKNMANNAK
jgi:hypothetical protein